MAFDVELVSLGDDLSVSSLARALECSEAQAAQIAASLPRVVTDAAPDAEAEALFHMLSDLGAHVKLRPVKRPSVRMPSFDPASDGSSSGPSASSATDAAMRSSNRPGDERIVSPVDVGKAQMTLFVLALVCVGLGIAMVVDPTMIEGTTSGSRRASGRLLYAALQLIWSRPGGVVLFVLGLVSAWLGYAKPELFVSEED